MEGARILASTEVRGRRRKEQALRQDRTQNNNQGNSKNVWAAKKAKACKN